MNTKNNNFDVALIAAAILWVLRSRPAAEYWGWLQLLERVYKSGDEKRIGAVNELAQALTKQLTRTLSVKKALDEISRIAKRLPLPATEIDKHVTDLFSAARGDVGVHTAQQINDFSQLITVPEPGALELNADRDVREDAVDATLERIPRPALRGEVIPVWFATDRAPRPNPKRPGLSFRNKRNDETETPVSFGRADVRIPESHTEGTIERPAWWKLEFRLDEQQHMVIKQVQIQDLDHWTRDAHHAGCEGLLFIHGFRVSFEEALLRTAQLTFDLKFTGVPLCFSWSSAGKLATYAYDTTSIDWASNHLRDFLETVTTQLGLSQLHIIAHSMGNRALVQALSGWVRRRKAAQIGQVVHAAPDVFTKVFQQRVSKFGKFKQVTLYASKSDRALRISKKLYKGPRAGYAKPILVMPGLHTIDVTRAGAEMFGLGHSYYGSTSKVFADLYYLLRGFNPQSRQSVQPVNGKAYYELA